MFIQFLCYFLIFSQALFATIELVPYFQYQNQSLEFLRHLRSEETFNAKELAFWDKEMQEASTQWLSREDGFRLRAYLYVGQRDFAALAKEYKGEFAGSIDLLSSGIINAFCPEFISPAETRIYDPFTVTLSNIVLAKLLERLAIENEKIVEVTIKEDESLWRGNKPYSFAKVPSFMPWLLKSPSELRKNLPSNDKSYWIDQAKKVSDVMGKAGPAMKESIYFWASMRGPDSGDWFVISEDYIEKRPVQKEKLMMFRSNLATAVLDTLIAVYDTKYHYLVKRPSQINPSLKTEITVPNHPSYPAGHSAVGETAAVVLSFYFPENKAQWKALGEESGMSRIYAGIHYPIDHEDGKAIGKKVAEMTLDNR